MFLLTTAMLNIAMGDVSVNFFEPDEVFERTRISSFVVEAGTVANHEIDPPQIADVDCRATNGPVAVSLSYTGRLGLDFGTEKFGSSKIDRVQVGKRVYRARARSTRIQPEFSNLAYPARACSKTEKGECVKVGGFVGVLEVEQVKSLWLPAYSLSSEIAEGSQVRIRYRDINTGNPVWAAIDTSGFAEVLRWCSQALQSDAARVFRGKH